MTSNVLNMRGVAMSLTSTLQNPEIWLTLVTSPVDHCRNRTEHNLPSSGFLGKWRCFHTIPLPISRKASHCLFLMVGMIPDIYIPYNTHPNTHCLCDAPWTSAEFNCHVGKPNFKPLVLLNKSPTSTSTENARVLTQTRTQRKHHSLDQSRQGFFAEDDSGAYISVPFAENTPCSLP